MLAPAAGLRGTSGPTVLRCVALASQTSLRRGGGADDAQAWAEGLLKLAQAAQRSNDRQVMAQKGLSLLLRSSIDGGLGLGGPLSPSVEHLWPVARRGQKDEQCWSRGSQRQLRDPTANDHELAWRKCVFGA